MCAWKGQRGGNDRTDKASGQVGVAHWWWKRGIAQVEAASDQYSVSRKYENCKRDWGRQGIGELYSIMVMSCQVWLALYADRTEGYVTEYGNILPGMEWLPGMRPITVRVMKSTEARHLSARGSSTEPSMEDWPGNLLAM